MPDDSLRSAASRQKTTREPKRQTIGFLTANLHLGAARALWPGIVDAAEQQDLNLICFPGGGLHVQQDFEAQRNVLYDLVNTHNVDGLVSWASAVGVALDPGEVAGLHQRYHPLPIVSLALPMEGIAAVLVNSYEGMRAAIVHLIEAHGCRRLAFIRGPESHYYAQERYRAYIDVLQEHSIPLAPELVTPPGDWGAGGAAIQVLLDERRLQPGVDFDAVMAVSDLMALEALKTLQARGFQVPGDVALAGFNDSTEGRLAMPALTSVALPFYEQGARAVETLVAQLAGQATPDQVVLPSRLVVRQSCGCLSQAIQRAAAEPLEQAANLSQTWLALAPQLLAEMRPAMGEAGELAGWAAELVDTFRADLGSPSVNRFVPALERILRQVASAGGDVAAWQAAVSILRRDLLGSLAGPERLRCEDLCGQARVMIGDMAQRVQASRYLQVERQSQALRELGQALITTFDVDRLADVLAERLPSLEIASCYLSLYEDPASTLAQARLVLGYTERGRVTLPPGGRRFPAGQLAPAGLLPSRRHSLVVEPLYFQDEPLGFVLFEIGPRDGAVYEVLRGHLSSALKGALLFRQAQEARLAAEKADQIKTRLLANVSHELRTPLNIIVDHTKDALGSPAPYGITPPPALLDDLRHIQHSAEHQLRVINDLLDLSRAEIDELDLYLELLDPRPLLQDAFDSMAGRAEIGVEWRLELPERLPWIQADPVRLRQILLNLLNNADKFTQQGEIILGVEVAPPNLHLWVKDTGIGIPADLHERIFEPFVTAEHDRPQGGGIGLGLSITRRLVALHCGSMELDSRPDEGSTFHVYLPLPSLSDRTLAPSEPAKPVLLLISASDQPAPEVQECSLRQGLEIRRLLPGDDLDAILAQVQPAALAWDLADAGPGEWAMVRRLRNHPRLCQSPFILYGQGAAGEGNLSVGLTSFVVKPANGQALLDAINAAGPTGPAGPILIVDDDARARGLYEHVLAQALPDYSLLSAGDGLAAWAVLQREVPSLVILDLMMPGMDGFEVLDRMRADVRTRQVPVVILSGRQLSLDDVQRLEKHALVTLQTKGVLSDSELIATLHRTLFGSDVLPQQTSALVKRALSYLHQNYARGLARWEIAEAVGVSEDYLSRVFHRELGLSPWDYLNRYRVYQAKELLRQSNDSIRAIARQVGFKDQTYFSRVFRNVTGMSPAAFREHPEG